MLGKRDKDREVRPSSDEVEEQHSFDDLARGLASSTVSRGKALKLAGAVLLGSVAVPFLGGTAEAKKKKKKKKKKHHKPPKVCSPGTHLCVNPKDQTRKCCPKGTTCCVAGSGVDCCQPGINICNLLETGISACVTL